MLLCVPVRTGADRCAAFAVWSERVSLRPSRQHGLRPYGSFVMLLAPMNRGYPASGQGHAGQHGGGSVGLGRMKDTAGTSTILLWNDTAYLGKYQGSSDDWRTTNPWRQ